MPKLKTKKAISKRFKLTASGKLKRKQGFRQHDAWAKSSKQKRHLRKSKYVHPTDASRLKQLLQGGK